MPVRAGERTSDLKTLPALGRPMREEFLLDPEYLPLNHGSYGAYPKIVQTVLQEYTIRAERNPELWFKRDLFVELPKVRSALASYLNADDADDVVIVPSITAGMNAIFRSMIFAPGERILHFSTVFGAMRKVIQYIVDRSKGLVTTLEFNVTYPITNDDLVESFANFLNDNERSDAPIRIALIDHISSLPGVVNPIQRLIPLLKEKNILVLIDGAHAIGQVPIDLKALDVDFYITNCHKWLYTPRATAVMYVKKEHQGTIHPSLISQEYKQPSNFQNEFFWTGTFDYSPYMSVLKAIEFRKTLGEDVIRNYMHKLAVDGGALVSKVLGTRILQMEGQIGNMVDVELPITDVNDPQVIDPAFWESIFLYRFNMYAAAYKHGDKIWVRLSAQIYNDLSDFEKAAKIFSTICNEFNTKLNDKLICTHTEC